MSIQAIIVLITTLGSIPFGIGLIVAMYEWWQYDLRYQYQEYLHHKRQKDQPAH